MGERVIINEISVFIKDDKIIFVKMMVLLVKLLFVSFVILKIKRRVIKSDIMLIIGSVKIDKLKIF